MLAVLAGPESCRPRAGRDLQARRQAVALGDQAVVAGGGERLAAPRTPLRRHAATGRGLPCINSAAAQPATKHLGRH